MKTIVITNKVLLRDLVYTALDYAGYKPVACYDRPNEEVEATRENVLLILASAVDDKLRNDIRTLNERMPNVPIVLQCAVDHLDETSQKVGSYVKAVIADDKSFDVLIGSMCIVQSGLSIFHCDQISEIQPPIKANRPKVEDGRKRPAFSNREMAILSKVREGFANKEIARQLEISDSTVKVHLKSIFQKAGVKNRTQAAMWADGNLLNSFPSYRST